VYQRGELRSSVETAAQLPTNPQCFIARWLCCHVPRIKQIKSNRPRLALAVVCALRLTSVELQLRFAFITSQAAKLSGETTGIQPLLMNRSRAWRTLPPLPNQNLSTKCKERVFAACLLLRDACPLVFGVAVHLSIAQDAFKAWHTADQSGRVNLESLPPPRAVQPRVLHSHPAAHSSMCSSHDTRRQCLPLCLRLLCARTHLCLNMFVHMVT
jgi:hypothetical protein